MYRRSENPNSKGKGGKVNGCRVPFYKGVTMYKNIQKKENGDFVVDKEGYPYHIPANVPEYAEEYDFIRKYAEAYPDEITAYMEPVYEPTPEELKAAELSALRTEANELFQDITAGIASDEDKARLKELRLKIRELEAGV